jgi:DNA polymerase-3 subunit gamma/tau
MAPQAAATVPVAPGMESLRQEICSALAGAGHPSAAKLLGAGSWTLDGAGLRIEAPAMGKKMLSLTVNAAAEKIIRQQLQRLGAPTRLLIVPGGGSEPAVAPVYAPPSGGIREAALSNPLVQRAREIFKAEVRSVVDLRQK